MTTKTKTLCCIGAGYVGACTFAVIASHCPEYKLIVCDIDEKRIAGWNQAHEGTVPLFEPGLVETIQRAKNVNDNLFFTHDVKGAIKESSIIFIAVNTPTKSFGRGAGRAFDMSSWEAVSRTIAAEADSNKIIVEKSTVPVRTAEKVLQILNSAKKNKSVEFQIVSNPEFLAEGSAMRDLEFPDRVLVGGDQETPAGRAAIQEVCEIYAHWVPTEKIITTNMWTSELAKLASNAFLAQRISSINAISALCEECGGNVEDISRVLGMDDRIGSKYLKASAGFGGSCLKKDVMALTYISESYQLHQVADFFRGIVEINEFQKKRFATRIVESMYGNARGKKIAVLGFSFKKDTGDIRESCAIEIIQVLLSENANIFVFDPKVQRDEILGIFPTVTVAEKVEDAYTDADALVIITEWDMFKTYDYAAIFEAMRKPAFIFDGRNILDVAKLSALGFSVHSIGMRNPQDEPKILL